MSDGKLPLVAKIALGVFAVIMLTLLGFCVHGLATHDDAESRRNYAMRNHASTEGANATTLVPFQTGCSAAAGDDEVAKLGFKSVKCNDDSIKIVTGRH